MKRVLFACYGSGHVKMVLPVAQALARRGDVDVRVLGLTTAASAVRDAGLPLLQFRDFVRPEHAEAVAHGRVLAGALANVVDPDETAAYLGLCHADLVAEHGTDEAAARFARLGRQAFLPRRTLRRILQEVQPDLVVATNSPRAERAAIEAAREVAIPAVCLVDLFAIDEVRWIGQAGYADLVCVLNDQVREFLLQAGRHPAELVVTGNPAFDRLRDPEVVAEGGTLRERQGWHARRVVLWPEQAEPAVHPFDGRPGDPALPARVLASLVDWTLAHPDAVLCVRPRAGELPPDLPRHERILVTSQDWPLAPLLHAVDVVVTLTSTVGLEGHLAGARLVQVTGSVFDDAMPLERFGIADAAVPLEQLQPALDRWSAAPRRDTEAQGVNATTRVLAELARFL